MFYLYVVQKLSSSYDEVPEEKREWWHLVSSNENKQLLLDWHSKHKSSYAHGYKVVQATGTLPDFFYPKREIKRQSNAGKLLRSINWS
jgi:hypothetical protein